MLSEGCNVLFVYTGEIYFAMDNSEGISVNACMYYV